MAEYVTAERLRELLDYDPATGVFRRRTSPNKRYPAGSVAGCNSRGYRVIMIDDILYRAHRLAWLYVHGEWPKEEVDHINGDTSDNGIANLREATHSQNMRNVRVKKTNKIGLKGVSHDDRGYRARIWTSRGEVHLGRFRTSDQAAAAYADAAQRYFGEFARAG